MHRQHWEHAAHTTTLEPLQLKNHLSQLPLLYLLTVCKIILLILDLSESLEPAELTCRTAYYKSHKQGQLQSHFVQLSKLSSSKMDRNPITAAQHPIIQQ